MSVFVREVGLLDQSLYFAKLDRGKGSMAKISLQEGTVLNRMGYGIFFTINGFRGRRRKQDLVCINGWGVDIDEGDKTEQMALIQNAPLPPSIIIETKRGYQPIYLAKDAKIENYLEITRDRLRPYFNADPNACDVCRLLRVPGYLHLKDPNAPFLIKEISNKPLFYTEEQIREAFPIQAKQKAEPAKSKPTTSQFTTQKSRLPFKMSQADALLCLSGCPEVDHETFSFSENSNGTMQILVNGVPTSCWITLEGFIGSHDDGGPTVLQWLMWYDVTKSEAKACLKRVGIL